jgi:transposase
VYWKPVYNLLEGQFELMVVNAQHIKAVPGRKTDVKDAEWLAQLLRHGLLKPSFIPSAPQRELRELTRYRTSLVEERSRTVNRLQKVLEDSNIKLARVVSNIMGLSAKAMLAKLLEGESDPEKLADLAQGRLREKRAALIEALQGELKPHHRFMLTEQLGHIDYLDEAIERLGEEIEARLHPFEQMLAHLDTIPGVNQRVAEIILAEVGTDMTQFKDAQHLASWAGLCPGNHQSAGKRLSGRTRKGNVALRRVLTEAAHAAGKTKQTYLGAQYRRLAGRRGKKVAVVAVAHSILVIVYYILKRGEDYKDLGVNHYQEIDQAKLGLEKRYVKRLEKLGYEVNLKKTG